VTPGDGRPHVRLGWPDVGAAELAEVEQVLDGGILTMGPKVEEFEAQIARACEVDHAVAVTSGTAALHLAVLAFDLQPGDEVLVPAYTFPATANVVALAGLKPVLVDVDPETMNLDPSKLEMGPRTKLLLGVHLFGRPLPLEELPDLPLLEDAAGALGARRRGRACGALGVAGCLSFHPRKIVTTGEGGAVTTSDDAFAAAVRSMRNHGWRSLVPPDMPAPGLNYRLSDILCAVGLPQVRRLDELLAARTRIADGYGERLRDLPVLLPRADEGDVHGWQAYVIQVEDRDRVMQGLRAQGIEAQIGTYALHLLGAYRDQGDFPGATRVFERALALPFHTRLDDRDLDRVAEALDRLVSNH
jgi:dTDP-4-amino-4,6-dideoxygalactose transaminase